MRRGIEWPSGMRLGNLKVLPIVLLSVLMVVILPAG